MPSDKKKPDGTAWLTTYVRVETKKKLRILAAEEGTSMAALAAKAIEGLVKKESR